MHVHDQHQQPYLSILTNTSKEGLELLRLLINSGALLCKMFAGSKSTLCNKDVGPITLHPLYDVYSSSLGDGLQSNVWLDHHTISSIDSLVVKRSLINLKFVDVFLMLVIVQPTYVALVLLYG